MGAGCGTREAVGEAVAIEHVVAQNKAAVRIAYKGSADGEGLCKAIGAWLLCIAEVHAPLRAIAEQALEEREIMRCGDNKYVAHACEHECAEWVVDHRFVVHRKDLLGDGFGERVKACARAACEDDALPLGHERGPSCGGIAARVLQWSCRVRGWCGSGETCLFRKGV